ncbi:prostatic acid phosphatase-like [Chironomus tepperi]|uniref:prostatic acid phosphatase-like n=1 Tax=Chironomus tepperi TaxID=113505 RepID=UPI00391F4317
MSCLQNELFTRLRKRKVFVSFGLTMVILFFIIFFINSSSSSKLPNNHPENLRLNQHHDLKLVHVIFRHGARTPADTYPNDIYINETFEPYGWGQLTNRGKLQMYELGSFLRQRYHTFLSKTLNLNEIYAQSTGVSRTKMSLQLVLAALFPPKETALEWNQNLNWQPIPYNYQELPDDTLLLVRKDCPRYHEEFERVMTEEIEVRKCADQYAQLYDELSNITGLSIKTPDDIQSLYSTLKAEREFGLKLPEWTEEYFPERMQELTDKSYIYNAYNSLMKRLKGGVFLKKAINDWNNKKIKQKIFLYAGHDSSVTNILSAFNVWAQQFPDYGATGILEFSQNKVDGTYGVEIFLKNSNKNELVPLTIPGCAQFCELSRLQELLKDNIPQDWKEECKPLNEDFTAPPPSGP